MWTVVAFVWVPLLAFIAGLALGLSAPREGDE